MPYIVQPNEKVEKILEQPEPNVMVGQYLQEVLESPFSAKSTIFGKLLGREHEIFFGNSIYAIAYTYCDEYGNEGIKVIDVAYNDLAIEWATKFEAAHPESAEIAVHLAK